MRLLIRDYIRSHPICLFSVAALLSLNPALLHAQGYPIVDYASLKTEHKVKFEVSLPKSKLRKGEDIEIDFSISNQGRNHILFLDSLDPPSMRVVDLGEIRIFSAFQYVDDHFPVRYKFHSIKPGRSFKGRVTVPSKLYLDDTKYSFEDAELYVDFAYMIAEKPLLACSRIEWPRPCLFEVSKLAKNVSIGQLRVIIEEKP